MIPKLGKRTKTCKTEISGKSLISPFFQRQFRSPFPYKLKTEVDFLGGLVGGSIWAPKFCQKPRLFWVYTFRPSNWSWNEYKSCVSLRRGGKSSLFAYQIPTPARLSVTMVLKIHTKTCMVMILTLWIVMMPEGDSPVPPIQWDARNKTC